MRTVCLVLLLSMSSACLAQPAPTPQTRAELRVACNLDGEISGTLSQFEYSNFWPDHCPAVAFRVASVASEEVGQALRQLYVEDPATHEKKARVWVRVQKSEGPRGPYLTVTSVRPVES